MPLVDILQSLKQEFLVTDDGVCSQVPDSGKKERKEKKERKSELNEETALLGVPRKSVRSHLKRGLDTEESTLKGSQSSQQEQGNSQKVNRSLCTSPGAGEERNSELESAAGF